MAENDLFKKIIDFANDVANESAEQEESYRQIKNTVQKFASNAQDVYNEVQYWSGDNKQQRENDLNIVRELSQRQRRMERFYHWLWVIIAVATILICIFL